MIATVKTSVSIPKTLLAQAEVLAQQLNISQSDLFELALEHFISNHHSQPAPNEQSSLLSEDEKGVSQTVEGRSIINQGDIFWVQLEAPDESEPGIPHPHVIIQDNVLNHSRILTVVACALTTNIKRANLPGTVLLEAGEANLPKQSLVETSKVSTIDKAQLGEYIGSLNEPRIDQILAAMRFLQTSFFPR